LSAKNTLRDVDAAIVEAAFASRIAELGEDNELPLPSPRESGDGLLVIAEPPSRAALMAALRASVERCPSEEVALPADRRRPKRRSHVQPLSAPPQPAAPSAPEPPQVNNAVVWHVGRERSDFAHLIRQ
jgi:hypothetical protein